MAIPNKLGEKLRNGEVVLGVTNMYPAAGIIESMARGWDFVWIDAQHGQMGYDSCLHALHAACATGIDQMLRVPGHDHTVLGPFADLSPSAIMVPMVNNAKEAKYVADGLRFPPVGTRSYGGRRVIDLHGRDYYREQEMIVVAQIETLEAVENAEAIINTPGIDALFFGPDDMKVRMNIPINTAINENKQLQEAMKKTADAARKAGKIAGSVAATGPALTVAVELGYQLIVSGGDVLFLRVSSAAKLEEMRGVLKGAKPKPATSSAGVYGA